MRPRASIRDDDPDLPGAETGEATVADTLLAEWRERIDRGETVDVETEIRAHPALADRLRAGLAALRRLDRRFGGGDGGGAELDARGDGPAGEPAAARLVGTSLGAWRLEAVLGAGGMGTVYRAVGSIGAGGSATPAAAPVTVALKLLHPHLFDRPGFFKRFLREAEIGRRVRHANVVRTLDADEVLGGGERRRFLVMEYVEGRTLRQVLAEDGKLPEALCRHVGHEVAAALAAIHAAGAVHRDVKPENVILSRCAAPGHDHAAARPGAQRPEGDGDVHRSCDHVVKLMDLGVARLADEAVRLSQTGVFVGSLLYAAPEQFGGAKEIDARADLHALGLLLYELATGIHPFQSDDVRVVLRRIADETPRRCGEIDPQIAPFFEEVVARLLEKDPERRFATAEEVAAVLDEGEESGWWRERAKTIRATTKRPLRRIRIPRETALYGRDAELARLRTLYDKAKSGDGQVVLVEGEAGIGKSRLVDEFVALLQRDGEDVEFLFGSYPPGGAATSSGAFTTAFREHFGEESLDDALREALPQTPILVPAFASLLRGDAAPTGAEPLTKDSLQTVFVHATRWLASRRTTILLIEDLHFAPEEGRGLFVSLALAAPGHRILLVGATRPGLDEPWIASLTRLPQTTPLPVPRLGPKDLIHVLRDALRSERLAEELAALIAVKSDGNPFFVFELLRGLRDGQFLRQRPDGTWETTQILRDIQVPPSILELVQARVADLSRDERNALDVASCLGFEFDPALVGAVLGVGRIPLLQGLAHVEKAHRLVRSAGRRFVFDHHQVQEALYGGLPELLREEYHAAIGAALEAQADAAARDPATLDGALCVALAEHFLRGGHAARSRRYLSPALDHLVGQWLHDAVSELMRLMLDAPDFVTGVPRGGLLRERALYLHALGRSAAAEGCLDEAIGLTDAERDGRLRAVIFMQRAEIAVRDGRTHDAKRSITAALPLQRQAGDWRGEAQALGILSHAHGAAFEYEEERALLDQSLALAVEHGDAAVEATTRRGLASHLRLRGRLDEARAQAERALDLARAAGDARGEGDALEDLGAIALMSGRFDEAVTCYADSLALARRHRDAVRQAELTGGLGYARFGTGHLAEALHLCEWGASSFRAQGNCRKQAWCLVNLGVVLATLGAQQPARSALEESRCLAMSTGHRFVLGYALVRMAWVAGEIGSMGDAVRLVDESLEVRRGIRHSDGIAESLLLLGRLRSEAGDAPGARAHFAEAQRIAGAVSDLRAGVIGPAIAAALLGDDAERAARALAASASRLFVTDRMEAHACLWQATRDPVHLAEAKRLLDHLVAHAPPEYRESMLTNVRLHREIMAAWAAHGTTPAS